MILHLDLPIVRVHPSGNEIVIVRVELARAPFLVRETMSKLLSVENSTAVSDRAARQARKTAVNVQARGAIKVPSLQVCCPKEAPNAKGTLSLQPLRSTDTTDRLILKRS